MNSNYIFLPKKDRREKVLLENILYLKACGSSTEFVVEDPKHGIIKFVFSANLKNITPQISNPNFLRVHRSFLINRNKVEAINGRQLVINGEFIPYSEPYKHIIAAEFPILKT